MEWRKIERFAGYEVSENGDVRNVKTGRTLKPITNKKGYLRVRMKRDEMTISSVVHRLVAEAFVENPLNLPQVNHKDGNKKNNHFSNLEWMTGSENIRHRIYELKKHGGIKVRAVVCVETGVVFPSVRDAARAVGGDVSNISRCCKKEGATVKGFHWRYKT